MEQRLPEIKEVSLYRIIQEWLGNVLRYGSAKKISIHFTQHEREVNIMIEDDGPGFDIQKFEQSKGNGWRNINSRLQLIKGELEIDTQPSRTGTTFMIDLPNAFAPLSEQVTEDIT
jgi:signal transduction histidine kinase